MYGYSNDFICLKFGSLCFGVWIQKHIYMYNPFKQIEYYECLSIFFQAKRSYQDNGSLKERQLQRHVIVNNLIHVLNETELSFP